MRLTDQWQQRAALAWCLALVIACAPGDDQPARPMATGGTVVISASADADILLPPLTMSVQGKQIADQIFDPLAEIGADLNTVGDAGFRPRLAESWTWGPDSSWIEFRIHPRATWHDGRPVTASDVRFTFALVRDTALGSPLGAMLEQVDSVTLPAAASARVWLNGRPPNVFFRIATGVPILPEHLLSGTPAPELRTSQFARAPVGSGRFRFAGWVPATSVTLVADSANYRGRPSPDRVVWVVSADYDAAAMKFIAGDADFLDVVRPELVERAAGGGRKLVADVPSLNYGYVAFNLKDRARSTPHPVFGDREVRRALVMAVDRAALVRNVFDTLGRVAHGPVTRALATSDTTIGLPYDTAAAAALLDAAGWRRSGGGIRSRGGRPLRFSVLVPSSSATRNKFAVLLQEQWRRIGADVRIESLEISAFGGRLEGRDFDAFINAWQIDPDPASIRDEWLSPERNPNGFNFASYSNPEFDALVDSAARSSDPARSVALYRRAYRTLTDDAPAMWLYEPRNVFGVSQRLEPVGMRADAWWAGLSDWRVTGG